MNQINPGDTVSFEIKVNGSSIDGTIPIQSIKIDQTINSISCATIKLLDSDPVSARFSVSESETFVPGNDITISMGYDGKNEPVFKGIVTSQTIRMGGSDQAVLEIECHDKAVKMTIGRKSKTYTQIKESDVFKQIISNSGLSSRIDDSSVEIDELVQDYCSNWDFLLSRAKVNGLVVSTINGLVSVFNPAGNTSPVLTLKYGENLMSCKLRLNSTNQYAKVKATSRDANNSDITSVYAYNKLIGPGNLSTKKLAEVIGLDEYELQFPAGTRPEELKNWAEAQMLNSELSKITGELRFQGISQILPGNYLQLEELSQRFNGDHFISSVRHTIALGDWLTDVTVGLSTGLEFHKCGTEA